MSRKSAANLLRPSLLDRLVDTDAQGSVDRVYLEPGPTASIRHIKQAIVRDIAWLLNANSLDQTMDLSAYPHVAASTMNFGAIALDGQHREGLDLYRLQESIATSLRRFESRLVPDSLRVVSTRDGASIGIRIEAEIHAEPLPLRVVMRTEIDPEAPLIRVVECRPEDF